MAHSSDWFTPKKDEYQVNSKVIYTELYPEILEQIDQDLPVGQIITWIRQKAREAFIANIGKEPTTGSLNNACGRWNEFIATSFLCELGIDLYQQERKCVVIFSIENSTVVTGNTDEISARFLRLFEPSEFSSGNSLALIQNIRQRIFFPSPDYLIALIEEDGELIHGVQSLMGNQARNPSSLGLYQLLRGKLKAQELKAVVSLKTSNRPDRRYQPSFEAAMIKAISHAAKQNWRYYMVASELSTADRVLFETAIAPHSVATGGSDKLVDGVYFYQRKADLQGLLVAALT
jgi:Cfr10I/Bse634I restriction endonuclease